MSDINTSGELLHSSVARGFWNRIVGARESKTLFGTSGYTATGPDVNFSQEDLWGVELRLVNAGGLDRHRSGGRPPTPATPPCVRVRTRRFELVTLTVL